MEDVATAAQLLRTGRKHLGWSTTEVAKRVVAYSKSFGDPISLTQQAVSKFENERAKSVPRWMRLFRHLLIMSDLRNDAGVPINDEWKRDIDEAISFLASPSDAAVTKSQTTQQVMLPVTLPDETALAQMFEGLLDTIDELRPLKDLPRAELARELAQQLPSGLSALQGPLTTLRKAVEVRPRVLASDLRGLRQ